jgi:diacylglycerol kinase family enzyme
MKRMVILNPKAGIGLERDIANRLSMLLEDDELIIRSVNRIGDVGLFATEAAAIGCDSLIVAGGDGTIGQVVDATKDAPLPIGIIPRGRANDLAQTLRIPFDLEPAVRLIRAGKIRRIDSACINGRAFVSSCGAGLPVQAIGLTGRWMSGGLTAAVLRLIGHRGYGLGLLRAIITRKRSQAATIKDGNWVTRLDPFALIVSKLPRLGKSFIPTPKADPADRTLHLCLIDNRASIGRLFGIVNRVRKGSLREEQFVTRFQSRHVRVEFAEPQQFFADGDLLPASHSWEISIRPDSVALYTPEYERSVS